MVKNEFRETVGTETGSNELSDTKSNQFAELLQHTTTKNRPAEIDLRRGKKKFESQTWPLFLVFGLMRIDLTSRPSLI